MLTRRQSLQSLSSGFGYLAFSALAHEAAAASARPADPLAPRPTHFTPRARRVIFLCMRGGASHVDLYDHKPELARAAGQAISSGRAAGARLLPTARPLVPAGRSGLFLSPLLPALAQHADDLCVIRSMRTDLPNHSQAFGQMHTGAFQFVRPSLGAWSLYGLGTENSDLPGFITISPPADFGGAHNYGSAFLPPIYQGTKLGNSQLPDLYAALLGQAEEPGPPFKNIVPGSSPARQRAQIDLVSQLTSLKPQDAAHQPELEGAIASLELAFRMQAQVPDLLDLSREPQHVLDLYHIGSGHPGEPFARQCLLARRLAEAGVRFIELTAPVNWDHHHSLTQNIATACAAIDQPIGSLLADLKLRGLLDDTLVICASEFGRTPYAQGPDGRDHNHLGYSTWMAGAGVKGGFAYGETDEIGHRAVVDPVHIHDWHATILHLLGLDHTRLTYRHAGREFRLTDVHGRVATGILA